VADDNFAVPPLGHDGRVTEDAAPRRLPDPVTLVYAAPVISPSEDWRERSLESWVILAGHEGIRATPTDVGGKGFGGGRGVATSTSTG
jgi:hypothetical protein